jgi:hypothetical protein
MRQGCQVLHLRGLPIQVRQRTNAGAKERWPEQPVQLMRWYHDNWGEDSHVDQVTDQSRGCDSCTFWQGISHVQE